MESVFTANTSGEKTHFWEIANLKKMTRSVFTRERKLVRKPKYVPRMCILHGYAKKNEYTKNFAKKLQQKLQNIFTRGVG